jgi:protocatechuate 3,4-dioxygenase beta subunit
MIAINCRALVVHGVGLAVLLATAAQVLRPNSRLAASEPPSAGKAPALPVFVYGLVQDENGRPVPKARVWWRAGTLGQFQFQATDADEKGIFHFNIAGPASGMLVAMAEGQSFGGRFLAVDEGQAAQRAVLTLKQPERLRLRALDEAGQPVQGAEFDFFVEWKTDNGDSLSLPLDILSAAGMAKPVSDKEGLIELGNVPKGTVFNGRISHSDFARQRFEGMESGKGPGEVKLMRGRALTLTAVNGATKKPVPGALFLISVWELRQSFIERANADGRATIRLSASRRVSISVRDPQLMCPAEVQLPDWKAASDAALELEMFPKVKVTGRCLDEGTGKPLAGIQLGLVSRGAHVIIAQATSDSEGRYEMEGPEGPVTVEAISAVDPLEHRKVEGDTAKSIQMPDLKLKVLMVRGKVVGPDGKPVANAFVMTTPLSRATTYLAEWEGRFAFRMEDRTDGMTVTALHPTNRMSVAKHVSLDDLNAGNEVVIGMSAETEIRGTVNDGNGQPCKGVQVWLVAKTIQGNGFSFGPQESTLTDAKGQYRFQGLLRDTKEYRVCHDVSSISHKGTWVKPAMDTIVLDPLTASAEMLKAQTSVPDMRAAPSLKCRQWVKAPPLEIESLRGKLVLLVFNASWSKRPGWAEQLAEIQMAHRLYAEKGLAVIGIQHHGERQEDVEAMITKEGLTFPVGIDNADGETFDRYRVNYYPQYVLIGRDGKRVDERWRNGNFLAAVRKAMLYGDESGR